jgi:glycosyltransferase involved in cell wall biosynthesis
MRLSVIVACRNDEATLPRQLDALAAQQWPEPWEVIVSDNGSTDGSRAAAERFRARIPAFQVVDSSDRRGPAHARNVAVRHARGEALAFCDADDEVAPGWVAAMGRALAKHDFVACRMDLAKLNPPGILRGRPPQNDGVQAFTYPPFLPHAGGGTLGIKRAIHETVGGFDESLRLLSDTDYCWRVQLTGVSLEFVPDAVVYVELRHSLKGMFRQARGWGEYDVLLYKRYQSRGMPRLAWKSGLAAWRSLLRNLPRIRDEEKRLDWVWNFGWRLGRLQGSIKHRVVAL